MPTFFALLLALTGCRGAAAPSGALAAPPPSALATHALAVAASQPPSATPRPTQALPTLTATASATPSATATAAPTLTASATPTATQTPRPTAWPTPDGPLTQEERALLFDELWLLVNERYLDPNHNGVNWAAQREWYRPRALAAPDDVAYYALLREMVELLNDSHSRFMTPDEANEHFEASRNELAYAGFGLYTMTLDQGALVLQVMAGSPAEQAGIRACDTVFSVNGARYVEGGAVGSGGTMALQRPGVGPYSVTLTRAEVQQVIDVTAFVLPDRRARIAYVRVDTLWVRDAAERLRARLAALEAEGPLDGLILDLRPNLGGWRPVLQGILGTFVAGQLGEFNGRLQSDPLIAPPPDAPPPAFADLPLMVLVGPRTESYAEVLAAVLQAERGATVLGQATRGNVETIFPRRLPFSARVWIAEQGFRLPDGRTLEGIGVQPDIWDNRDWTGYACGMDPQVQRAAELLEGGP